MTGVIFDCDGTLVDTESLHYDSWNRALEKHSQTMTREEYSSLAGRSSAFIAEKLCLRTGITTTKELIAEKRGFYYSLQSEGVQPIERTVKVVRHLLGHKDEYGIKVGLASASRRETIFSNLNRLQIAEGFDAIVSGSDDLHSYRDPEGVNKPKPYIYKHTAQLLGIEPERCIVFEDSEPGVMAAVRAGMIAYAVPNAFTLSQDFSKAACIISPDEEINITRLCENFFSYSK